MVATRRSKAAAAEAPPVEEDDVSTSSSEHVANDDDNDDSSDSDNDSEASGSAQDMSEDEDDASSSDEEMDDIANQQHPASTTDDINDDTNNTEQCTFDLHNLLAFNTHQINAAELYQSSKSKKKSLNQEWYTNTPTIDSSTTTTAQILPAINENLLLSKAAEGTTQLLHELWKLPSEKSDVGLISKLPSPEMKLPRALVSINMSYCVYCYYCFMLFGNCLCCLSFVLEHMICHIFLSHPNPLTHHTPITHSYTHLATTTTQTNVKMGTIRQRTWHST